MALKRLTNHEKLSVVQDWLGQHRAVLERIPAIAFLIENLEEIHAGFTARHPGDDDVLANLRVTGAGLDLSHDGLLKLGHGSLNFLADWHDAIQPGSGGAYRLAADQLWPDGPSMTLRSWREEAAHAIGTADWLEKNPDTVALLAAARPSPERTVLDVVHEWIRVGRELKLAVDRIAAREKELAAQPKPNYLTHRNAFIGVAEVMRRNLALNRNVSDEDRATLLEPLAKLEARADARRNKRAPDPGANPAVPEADLEVETPVVA